MAEFKLIYVPRPFRLHHWSTAGSRLPALHKPSACWCTCVGHPCSTISSRRRKVTISSVTFTRHHVMHPLLSKRSTPQPTCRGSTVSSTCLPGHRRLRVRATVRMMPISIRKGSQVFRKPAQLTCFPWIRARRQRLTIFHEVLFSYRIRFRAMATCE